MPEAKKISELPVLSSVQPNDILPIVNEALTQTSKCTASQIAEIGGGPPGDNTVTTPKIANGAVTYSKIQPVAQDRLLGRASPNAGVVEEVPCTQFGREWLALANSTTAATLLNLQLFNNPAFTGTVTAETIAASVAITAPSITGDSTIVRTDNPALALVAWANFFGANGTIRAGYNVSSITRIAAGRYRFNFLNPLPDLNYCVLLTPGGSYDVNIARTGVANSPGTDDRSTSDFPFIFGRRSDGAYSDCVFGHVAVFR